MEYLTAWIFENWIELSGALISLVYLFFSYKQIIWLWPFGLLSAIFYIWIYYFSGFYADMSLQIYYVFVSIYGWYHWTSGKSGSQKPLLKVSQINRRSMVVLTFVFGLLWLIISQVLIHYTDSQVPVMDALTTAGGIVATWMLARKVLEHWLLWVVIDLISMGLYLYKELYATAILFLIYSIVAIAGYQAWKKTMAE